jgi:fermentation-respiration switch protein FrsA (DUF1100 family)
VKRVATVTLGALLVVAALLVSLWLAQRRLIYIRIAPPVPQVAAHWPNAEDVSFETEDGLRLRGWFLPPDRRSEPAPAVLVCNGNAGTRADRLPLGTALASRGFAVLLFDYRGYADNPGAPSEDGLLRDARAARAALASRTEVAADRIVYFGESLGSGVAVALAAEQPPAALVLRSPFTSLVDVARVHYPFLPVRLLLRDRFRSDRRIGGIRSPLLVVAGDRDSIVPYAQSRRLFELAPGSSKRFVPVPGADHNDPRLSHSDTLVSEVVHFLSRHAGLAVGASRMEQP